MLWRQVGPDGDVEARAAEPLLCEGLAARLNHGVGAPARNHRGERLLDLGRLRRGEMCGELVQDIVGELVAQGGEQSGGVPGMPEQVSCEPRCRCLALGARHADDRKLAARVVVEGSREVTQSAAVAVDPEIGDGQRLAVVVTLTDDECCPTCQRIGDEAVTVVRMPAHGHERIPGLDPSRVVRHAGDVCRAVRRRALEPTAGDSCYGCEIHWVCLLRCRRYRRLRGTSRGGRSDRGRLARSAGRRTSDVRRSLRPSQETTCAQSGRDARGLPSFPSIASRGSRAADA